MKAAISDRMIIVRHIENDILDIPGEQVYDSFRMGIVFP